MRLQVSSVSDNVVDGGILVTRHYRGQQIEDGVSAEAPRAR